MAVVPCHSVGRVGRVEAKVDGRGVRPRVRRSVVDRIDRVVEAVVVLAGVFVQRLAEVDEGGRMKGARTRERTGKRESRREDGRERGREGGGGACICQGTTTAAEGEERDPEAERCVSPSSLSWVSMFFLTNTSTASC
eukprot:2257282-Rhodomonas_salina.1